MSAENNCKYVCSRGLMKSCDVYTSQPISSIRQVYEYDWSLLQSGKTVYINTSAIPYFAVVCLPKIPVNVRFVLVSGDADETAPNDLFASHQEFLKFIEDSRIIHWFSQNAIVNHSKLTRTPIGLDYHTLASGRPHWWGPASTPIQQEQLLEAIVKKAKPLHERKSIIYCNFHFQMDTNHAYDRREALKEMPPKLLHLELQPQPRMKSWATQTGCAFVASPHGGGYDCHRTWEALALGCIPIVKTSGLDPLFEGLPVLIVKRWSDVNMKLLENTKQKFKDSFTDIEHLKLSYWIKLIKSFSQNSLKMD
jgi:hypothetical protein